MGVNLKKRSQWVSQRTTLEKCLTIIVIASVILCTYLIFCSLNKNNGDLLSGEVCTTPVCVNAAAQILNKIDFNVNPCDDFYKFSCGKFLKSAHIPDDKQAILGFTELDDEVELQLRKIFEEPIKDQDLRTLKMMKTLYNSCMNTTRINDEGVAYLLKLFKNLGGWPVLEGGFWNEKQFDWKILLYNMRRIGLRQNYFLFLHIDSDMKNSSRNMLWISQTCANKWYKEGFNNTFVKATYEFMVDIVNYLGGDRIRAVGEMREVIDFKIKLAKIIVPYEELKNKTEEYNPMSIRELQKRFPSIPWLQYINGYLAPMEMVTLDEIVNVQVPKYLHDLEELLLKTPKKTLANYMFWNVLLSSHLPDKIKSRYLQYQNIVYGNSALQPQWKECVDYTSWSFSIATSYFYVQKHFDKKTKKSIGEILLDIRRTFIERLINLDWIDPVTKQHALIKAKDITPNIGYPEQLMNETEIERYYETLELNEKAYILELELNMSLFSHMYSVKQLREPYSKNDWRKSSHSFLVNAFYSNLRNNIDLPAAVLQGDYFNNNRPNYMNYGTIGEIIGHEFIHGFDDKGRQFDKDGNVFDWWQPETSEIYSEKSQCFIEQYSKYFVPETEMKLNGVNTLGENIADNGGIKLAYESYEKWLNRHGREPMLPGLNYTERQMFWISAATTWCSKYTTSTLKNVVLNGNHAPAHYRVLVPYMNSGYFAKDFNCPVGSDMNPEQKCEIW